MVIVAGLALPSFRDGPGLLDCQQADRLDLRNGGVDVAYPDVGVCPVGLDL